MARGAKEKLFEEQYYNRIFTTANPLFYLTRYWVMREVLYQARGNKARHEARFLIAHLIWSAIAASIRSASESLDFVRKCEQQQSDLVVPLRSAIDSAFVASAKFYSANRGSGVEAVDLATFFKSQRASAKSFLSFWNDSCLQRTKVDKLLEKAISAID